MDVNTVGNTFISTTTQGIQRAPEAAEGGKAGPDRDADADDGGRIKSATSPATPPAPANVNLQGQKIGQAVNVKA